MIYKQYHQKIVLKKIKLYGSDVNSYRRSEWSHTRAGDINISRVGVEKEMKLFGIKSYIELDFMKQFFSIKA